ncbi:DUF3108 domain-containing protein [Gammaproteobacteria bacterium]|nr:DUF3108 domain-containing protein [Gammaproteobacteria bacterium]
MLCSLLRQLFSLLPLLLILSTTRVLAEPPIPFAAEYEARYQGIQAQADRSLEQLDEEQFLLRSRIKLRLLGKTVSRIDEQSQFLWLNNQVQSQAYEYIQTGLGEKARSVAFDWQNNSAVTLVNDEQNSLALDIPVLDELSSFMEIKRQLEDNIDNIYFNVVDEDEIESQHYQVLGEEQLSTPLGNFNAIKLQRVRNPESKRSTEIWLATDWDYLLLKLYQTNSSGEVFEINLRQASLAEVQVTPLAE